MKYLNQITINQNNKALELQKTADYYKLMVSEDFDWKVGRTGLPEEYLYRGFYVRKVGVSPP